MTDAEGRLNGSRALRPRLPNLARSRGADRRGVLPQLGVKPSNHACPRTRAADPKATCGDLLYYSINSSALTRSVFGKERSSALAVLRLMTSSNLVGCSIGRSAGAAPLRILST